MLTFVPFCGYIKFEYPLFIRLQDRGNLFRRDLTVGFLIDHHCRRQTARTDAPHLFQGEIHIARTLSCFNVQLLPDGVQNFLGAFDMASGTETDANLVFPLGLEAESVVEVNDAGV